MSIMTRGVLAIGIGYSAYMAEIFRAGIEAVPRGQIEAAKTIGLRDWQIARFIVFPQAVAIVLPALGNEFIAMLKDTALLSLLSLRELTQRMREHQAETFQAFPAFNSAALIYIILTLLAASCIKSIDRLVNKKYKKRIMKSEKAELDFRQLIFMAETFFTLLVATAGNAGMWIVILVLSRNSRDFFN